MRPAIRTQNLSIGPGIETGSSDRLFWSGAHCDSATKAGITCLLCYLQFYWISRLTASSWV